VYILLRNSSCHFYLICILFYHLMSIYHYKVLWLRV